MLFIPWHGQRAKGNESHLSKISMQLQMLVLKCQQSKYYIKLGNSYRYRLDGIAKDTPTDVYCRAPMLRLRNMILQVDMSTSCLARVLIQTALILHRKPQAWAIPFLSSPGLADVVQQYFPFQMIVEPDGRSKVLPVTDIDKELFADKPDFVVI